MIHIEIGSILGGNVLFPDVPANPCLDLKPQIQKKHIIGDYKERVDGSSTLYRKHWDTQVEE